MRDKERGEVLGIGSADGGPSGTPVPTVNAESREGVADGGRGKQLYREMMAYAEREFARKRREDALPVKHISLGIPRDLAIVQKETDGGTVLESNIKYIIKAYEREVDARIMAEIVEIGRAAGVSDIFLLDKPKITAALLHAVPLPPKRVSDILCACPSCGAPLSPLALPRHCDDCGQAIDGQEVTE